MDPDRPKPWSKPLARPRALVTEPLGTLLASVPKSRQSWLTIVKTTVAATTAWVLARQLGDNAAVLFAPIVAILTLQASVYGSIATGLQLLFANLVGTALAVGWVRLFGLTWWSLALAALAALALARQVTNTPLARNQLTIAMLAVLVLAPVAKGYGQWRFVDVAIGSVVGLLVAVAVPERPRMRQARDALATWAAQCVTVLHAIADELDRRDGEPVLAPPDRHNWILTSRALTDLSADAAAEVAGIEETVRLNVAAGRLRQRVADLRDEQLFLVRITLQVRAVSLATDRLYDRAGQPPALDRHALAGLLRSLAALLRERLDGGEDVETDDTELRSALTAAVERVHTVFPSAVAVLDSVSLLGRLDQLRQDIGGEDATALVDPDTLPRS
ncbi:aromatic acid exporter family protein [Dactylosporangium sp. NBC_01737]|uniref:FUSC family protein n=1 Tax=Dactylosporangium sp. NBC_01737 TaxID=2975959 RepID=UPI002E167BCA|nr:aromatic acid exporter family protein [Dactylosporangium sp. NBC_01737]